MCFYEWRVFVIFLLNCFYPLYASLSPAFNYNCVCEPINRCIITRVFAFYCFFYSDFYVDAFQVCYVRFFFCSYPFDFHSVLLAFRHKYLNVCGAAKNIVIRISGFLDGKKKLQLKKNKHMNTH